MGSVRPIFSSEDSLDAMAIPSCLISHGPTETVPPNVSDGGRIQPLRHVLPPLYLSLLLILKFLIIHIHHHPSDVNGEAHEVYHFFG